MRLPLIIVASLLVSAGALANDFVSGRPFTVGGSGGALSSSASIYTAGCIFDSTGIDCVDVLSHVFNIRNSGTGSLILQVDGGLVWNINNDGPGSGLDADLLDGLSSNSFLKIDASNDPLTGSLSLRDMTDCADPSLNSAGRLTTGYGVVQGTAAITWCRLGAVVGSVTSTWNFSQDVVPDVTDARNLGTDALQWNELHVDSGSSGDPSVSVGADNTGLHGTAAILGVSVGGGALGGWTATHFTAPAIANALGQFRPGLDMTNGWLYVRPDAGDPTSGDCDEAFESGRQYWNTTAQELWICDGTDGWRVIASVAP